MKAVRIHGVGDVRLDEVPEPGDPGPGEVLVAPAWCGLCGTDAREFFGPGGAVPVEPHPLTGVSMPVVLGHELSARVVALGPGVDGPPVGSLIAVNPLVSCGRCAFCLAREPLLCPDKAWTGLSTATGGLGDLALIRADQAVPAPGLTPVQAAVVEPTAVALEALKRGEVRPGATVLVVGCGPIGALAILGARALGAGRVLAADPDLGRLALAVDLGADAVDPAADLDTDVDVAIDCAGKPGSIDAAVRSLRPGGRVVVPAVHPEARLVDLWGVTRRMLTITGSLGYTDATFRQTVALVGAGRLPVERIVSHKVPRELIVEAGFEAMRPGRAAGLKTLISVGGDGGG